MCLQTIEALLVSRRSGMGRIKRSKKPKEADKLEEMAANEMAVGGYYVVAGL